MIGVPGGFARALLRPVAFILMLVACHHENGGQQVAISGTERLDRYGIGRDAYEAHKMLARLGLVTIIPDPGRHLDGKSKATVRETRRCGRRRRRRPDRAPRADRLPAQPLNPPGASHRTRPRHETATPRPRPARRSLIFIMTGPPAAVRVGSWRHSK